MYYVIFKDDDGRLVVKNKSFIYRKDADDYAASIDKSRSPCVVRDVVMSDYDVEGD